MNRSVDHVVIVGGGVLGTMHAVAARRRGISVTHIETDAEPRGATVRNFGFIQVGARAPGMELDAALRSRAIWGELGAEVSGIGFRGGGSITILTHPEEVDLASQIMDRPDSADRGFKLLDASDVRAINPALAGEFLGGIHSTIDAVVEPRQALPSIRGWLASAGGYRFLPNTVAVEVDDGGVTDQRGGRHLGDHVVFCPGASDTGISALLLAGTEQQSVSLQMFQTEPHPHRLTTAVAGGDVMLDYPGFDIPSKHRLPPRDEVATRYDSHLLVTQRASGELTVGDTHNTDSPLPFDIDETPIQALAARVESILGTELPPIYRRWSGVYGRAPNGDLCLRREVGDGVTLVSGVGGRGMTISPAVAEDTFELLIGEEAR